MRLRTSQSQIERKKATVSETKPFREYKGKRGKITKYQYFSVCLHLNLLTSPDMKWIRRILKGLSLTAALFVFQACYGTPQSVPAPPEEDETLVKADEAEETVPEEQSQDPVQ